MDSKELQPKEKMEVEVKGEWTQGGPKFVPPVDILEKKDVLILIADIPGVNSDGVEIDLKDNELTIKGRLAGNRINASPVYTEYESGDYVRSFTLSNVIDQDKIEASIKDGVLRIILPKSEAAKPRQITVKAG